LMESGTCYQCCPGYASPPPPPPLMGTFGTDASSVQIGVGVVGGITMLLLAVCCACCCHKGLPDKLMFFNVMTLAMLLFPCYEFAHLHDSFAGSFTSDGNTIMHATLYSLLVLLMSFAYRYDRAGLTFGSNALCVLITLSDAGVSALVLLGTTTFEQHCNELTSVCGVARIEATMTGDKSALESISWMVTFGYGAGLAAFIACLAGACCFIDSVENEKKNHAPNHAHTQEFSSALLQHTVHQPAPLQIQVPSAVAHPPTQATTVLLQPAVQPTMLQFQAPAIVAHQPALELRTMPEEPVAVNQASL